MPYYEHVYLARQDLAPAQVEALTEGFQKIISDHEGAVASQEYWGLRSIAYRIKKNRKAHYVLLNIEAPAAAVQELERQVALNEDVIRYMTIRVDKLETEQSAMMRKADRAERGDRGDRGDRGGDRPDRGDRGDRGAPRAPREQGAW
ncbi:30S ribosomal protein S6 [Sandaracinobacteroides saxicola]|uniref:Small ribosomal subunit protein bS6 n=1 Tax=Sandaracinobacteroides saxicola TaxID=2759707 RepID=A0A7G5IE80_9SPHN|nr:30S ribosomal protein S6 [Sandaracinobacteroides saxicola]QMW21672.1 30S ribosomal protein S6 [Sandaracinobacteroides saxicola]